MIADIKISINFNHTMPDGAYTDTKGTVIKKKIMFQRGQNDVPCSSHKHSTLPGVLQWRVGNIFVK